MKDHFPAANGAPHQRTRRSMAIASVVALFILASVLLSLNALANTGQGPGGENQTKRFSFADAR